MIVVYHIINVSLINYRMSSTIVTTTKLSFTAIITRL